MEEKRVVHYINQFYGGYGGEDTASMGIVVKEEPVGPGLALMRALGEEYTIVRTIICGDNYIAENTEQVVPEMLELIRQAEPDLFIAGPGFNAGRYGLGCGALTAAVTEQLKIPAVTALYEENPGTDLYKNRCYIVKTDNNAKNMRKAVQNVAAFARRLVEGDQIRGGETEGYHGTGPAPVIDYKTQVGKRGVDMLLKKYHHEPFQTEVIIPEHEEIPLPKLNKPLSEAKIALVTDGGLVPKGNPDRMVPVNSKTFKEYSIEGKEELSPEDYEVSHQGYDNKFVLQNPNRLVPVDALRSIAKEGKIGSMLDSYFTTAGVMTPMGQGKKIGEGIAEALKKEGVDAVILTST